MLQWISAFFARLFNSQKPAAGGASPQNGPSAKPEEPPGPKLGTPPWYEDLFRKAELSPLADERSRLSYSVNRACLRSDRYRNVQYKTGVPWYLVAAIHGLEGSFQFNCCLHNGDPLGAVTVRVPKGRGPFNNWEAAAIDALELAGCKEIHYWTVGECLRFAEKYNGLGYLKRGLKSPYVWAGTSHYSIGKFIKDGVFDPKAKSQQVGAAALMMRLHQMKLIELYFEAAPVDIV